MQPRPSSDRDGRINRLAVPVLKQTYNLVISRHSCAGAAKKCTKKRDARAELLFCSKPNAFFDVPVAVAVAVVVSEGPLIVPTYRPTRPMT